MQTGSEQDVQALRRRIETAIHLGHPREFVVRLLEQLVAQTTADTETGRFALRQLAEVELERSPWRAALHLRRVLTRTPNDDVAHALNGLAHALQSNYRVAVAAYRHAVSLSPNNPWYNHNLGHLLDVALDLPKEGFVYLQRAHRLEPKQDEVTASYIHCLARTGKLEEALKLARILVQERPRNPEHKTMLRWLESGATSHREKTIPGLLAQSTVPPQKSNGPSLGTGPNTTPHTGKTRTTSHDTSAGSTSEQPTHQPAKKPSSQPILPALEQTVTKPNASTGKKKPKANNKIKSTNTQSSTAATSSLSLAVEQELSTHIPGGKSDPLYVRAIGLWRDYVQCAGFVQGTAAGFSAAIEYALARIDRREATQKSIGEKYNISVSVIQNRYCSLRSALNLVPGDPRYVSASPSSK